MEQTHINSLNLKHFWNLLLSYKWFIIIVTATSALLSVLYAVSLPDIYKSKALVQHVRQSENDFSASNQFGQLASMAGLSLSGSQATDNKSVDIATIQSSDFLSQFISKNNVMIPLFAAESWAFDSNKLVYSPEVYDELNDVWVRPAKAPFKPEPSIQEAVDKFREIFFIDVDRISGLVNMSVDFVSPELAQAWLSVLLEQFNEYVRAREIDIYDKNLAYLTKRVTDINSQEIRNVLFSLIEQEQKKAMLANVSKDYVFRIIDSPVAPLKKDSPKRALICATGTTSGFIIAILLVLFRQLLRDE